MRPSFAWPLAVWLGANAVHALDTVEAVGEKFFLESGAQFFIKGVAYQLTSDDPLIDGDQCGRDASLMSTLGVNTIRVYHVDPSADHSKCMSVFSDAGIYVLIDMDTFSTYILPGDPAWSSTQFDGYAAVMDAFHSYDNTLGFFVGNEIIALADQSQTSPFIKAAVRDMKAYRDAQGYRNIPIGYSAADIAQLRPMLQNYLVCGGNVSESIDFFSLNSYEWCDPSSYTASGYANLETYAVDFPVPIFFSETGCNVPGPRLFADQAAIFGPNMVNDWSGAIIYEWIEEVNNYGLISYGPPAPTDATGSNIVDGYTRAGVPTPVLPDFTNLKSQWATLNPTGVSRSDYNPSVSTPACPASTSGGWLVDGNVALPSLNGEYTGIIRGSSSSTTGASTAGITTAPETTRLPVSGNVSGNTPDATASASDTTATTPSVVPTRLPDTAGAAASASASKSPASAAHPILSLTAGLLGVMLFFTLCA